MLGWRGLSPVPHDARQLVNVMFSKVPKPSAPRVVVRYGCRRLPNAI